MVAVSARGNRRRRRWLIATVIVAVVAAWALVLGVKTLSAYHHDRDGLAALEQVKANLTPGQLTSSATERVLDQASAQFASAHSDLSSPFFGQSLSLQGGFGPEGASSTYDRKISLQLRLAF